MQMSFKQFLEVVNEDLDGDINKLMSDISMVDAQINQRTQPLIARKNQLTKMLAIKQKQKMVDDKRAGQQGDQQQGQPMQQGNRTVTPGSSGTGTPGSSTAPQ